MVGHQREQVGAAHPGAGARGDARGPGGAARHRARGADGHGGGAASGQRCAAPCSWRTPTRPLLRGRERCARFATEHEAAQRAVSILSGIVADPFGYGRVVRNAEGDVEAIVEEKDATDEQRAIREINSGILAFDAEFLLDALPRIGNDNAKGEYYLTDTVQLAREAGLHVGAHPIDDVMQTEGVNDRAQLAELGARAEPPDRDRAGCARASPSWTRRRPGSTPTWCSPQDVTLLPGVQLLGATVVGRGRGHRPGHHAQGLRDRRGARGRAHPRRARGDRRRGQRRPVRLPAARDPARRRRQDRHLRRDQERADRRRRQGAAPLLRRRRRDRRGHQHRRRHDLRQLRRRREAPHQGRQARPDRLQQHLRRARRDRRRRRRPPAAPSYAATSRRVPSPSAADRSATSRAGYARRRAGTAQADAAESAAAGRGRIADSRDRRRRQEEQSP